MKICQFFKHNDTISDFSARDITLDLRHFDDLSQN